MGLGFLGFWRFLDFVDFGWDWLVVGSSVDFCLLGVVVA